MAKGKKKDRGDKSGPAASSLAGAPEIGSDKPSEADAGAGSSGSAGDAGKAGQPPEEPRRISTAPLPLVELSGEFLGAFFEICFPDKKLIELCRELRITTPGYRLEALPPDQVARVLADEYLAAEDVRAALEAAVRQAIETPVQEAETLSAEGIDELIDLIHSSARGDPLQQMARVTWRALLDKSDKRMGLVQITVEDGIQLLDALERPLAAKKEKAAPGDKEAREAVKQADRAEKDRLAMKEQLAASRTEIAARDLKLAEQRAELQTLRAEEIRLSAEVARLTAAGDGKALADARRSADEARSLAEKLRAAEAALDEAETRADAAERRAQSAATQSERPAAPREEGLPGQEEAAEFLVPVLTREFYDSIDRWDRRMQRAAFEKIHLLAQNWRHGSLRALQLEGVPGYYRIRIATDVRLIYRREGAQLEVLSLIDREDLDRYIRQARTRTSDVRGKSEAPDAR